MVSTTYSVEVATFPKESNDYSYSATDTVQNLKQKIFESEGIPPNHQRLYVQYGWRNLWRQVDISNQTGDLLTAHLQTASRINLYLKLPNR